ncbi:MAG: M13 family metallopeptidase [Proteobacteria bacterium]|nr:M13 family metallopeptidase [Pseudomonadota bacterium]
MRKTAILLAALLTAGAAHAAEKKTIGQKAARKLPPVVDPAAVDKSVDPCSDFYQYSCGTWLKNNPVPGDETRWWRSSDLDEYTRTVLRSILEDAAKGKGGKPNRKKIGDYWASCMDEAGIEKRGVAPIKAEFERIGALKDAKDLAPLIARLHALGTHAAFSFGSSQDYTDARRMIAAADQGGLSLPDRDYYLLPDFQKERDGFRVHVAKMFEIIGDEKGKAAGEADAVLRVETALAKDAMDRIERREPAKVHHKTAFDAFAKGMPSFDWKAYLAGVGAPAFTELDVNDPGFYAGLEKSVNALPLEDWKTYLRWRHLHDSAEMGPAALVAENFEFFDKRLEGQKEIKPRWKRCVDAADRALGEAVGEAYVEREFSPEAKERVLAMVAQIEKSMAEGIRQLPWMGQKTRERALEKLSSMANKIGYPDKWRDYSKLEIVRGDAMGNEQRAHGFELRRWLAKIGGPVDRGEWAMTPPTNNAYYDPQMNDINFPAGILQPPNFDPGVDDAANFGAIGGVIGHELTHGFDDEGRHYDAQGNLKDWWTSEDTREFEARAKGFVDQYSNYVAVKDAASAGKDLKLNGSLTLGENTADNGGLLIAYAAFDEAMRAAKEPKTIDGYDPRQRFFVAYAQSWCINVTDEYAKKAATVDPHSPGRFRVNGVVANMQAFRKTFGCKEGSAMAPASVNRVW